MKNNIHKSREFYKNQGSTKERQKRGCRGKKSQLNVNATF